jgi:hypothetical protein
MTYYGHTVLFRFTFDCRCSRTVGPILEKFAYQYARLGAPQRCKTHGSPEVARVVTTLDGPHGEIELGWWNRQDGTRILLTWEQSSSWVRVYDGTEERDPVEWRARRVVKIAEADTIREVVGGGHRLDPDTV